MFQQRHFENGYVNEHLVFFLGLEMASLDGRLPFVHTMERRFFGPEKAPKKCQPKNHTPLTHPLKTTSADNFHPPQTPKVRIRALDKSFSFYEVSGVKSRYFPLHAPFFTS